jgi:hypothetical protein
MSAMQAKFDQKILDLTLRVSKLEQEQQGFLFQDDDIDKELDVIVKEQEEDEILRATQENVC